MYTHVVRSLLVSYCINLSNRLEWLTKLSVMSLGVSQGPVLGPFLFRI